MLTTRLPDFPETGLFFPYILIVTKQGLVLQLIHVNQ